MPLGTFGRTLVSGGLLHPGAAAPELKISIATPLRGVSVMSLTLSHRRLDLGCLTWSPGVAALCAQD